MPDHIPEEAARALEHDWDLRLPENYSEATILHLLADRIVQVLERGPETFFQLMYRLDISEKKLTAILNDDEVAGKIARLVYDRQLQKITSRQQFKGTAQKDDPDLEW